MRTLRTGRRAAIALLRAIVAGTLTLCLIATAATARDGAPERIPSPDWNGIYVGFHAGYATVDFDSAFDTSSISRPNDFEDATLGRDFDPDSGLGGLQLGWNATRGRVVWGIEADVSYLASSDRAYDPEDEGPGDDGSTTDNASIDINWLASLRGRVGITSARTLFFATAGAAWVNATYKAQNLDNSSADQGSVSLSGPGFVVGGGVEHAISNRLSVRMEGLYYGFDRRKDTNALTTDSGPSDFALLDDIIVARLGVNYRLNPSPAPANERPTSRAQPITWRGLYIGTAAGYALVSFDSIFDISEIDDNPLDTEDSVLGRFFDLDGAVVGGHIGYNHAIGRYIIGIEADWTYLGTQDSRFDADISLFGDDDLASADINWIASLRGRLGLTSAQTLFYATAGIAWVNADYAAIDGDFFNLSRRGSTNLNQSGYVVGGGLEHALNDHLLVRFEALHYQFGQRVDTSTITLDSDPGDYAKIKSISVARVGLSYKFGHDPR